MFKKLLFLLLLGMVSTCFAYDTKLSVDGELATPHTTLTPKSSDPATPTPQAGEIYYNSGTKKLRIYDGSWSDLGSAGTGGAKTAATKIVAASNSQGTTGCPGACANPRADYVCDGTDDQQEINKAINALPTAGGAVYLLEGTYNISATLLEGETTTGIVPHANTALIGTGKATVLKASAASSGNGIINANSVNNLLIKNLFIDCTGFSVAGIYCKKVNYSQFDSLWIAATSASTINPAIALNNAVASSANACSNNLITRSTFLNTVITIYCSSNNNIISDNYLGPAYIQIIRGNNNICVNNIEAGIQGGDGFDVRSAANNIFMGNIVQNRNSGRGFCLIQFDSSSPICNNNILYSNIIRQNSMGGFILYENSQNNIVSNNLIADNTGTTNYGGYLHSPFAGRLVCNNIISGNFIYNNNSTGTTPQLMLDILAIKNLISFNYISDTTGSNYGIALNNATYTEDNYLVGNNIGTWTTGYTAPINDLGKNTKYTDKLKMTLEKKTVTSSSLNVATNPWTYVVLNFTGTLTLADGKSAGDLLILESAQNSVTLNEGTNVNLGAASRALGQYDTLELIWNGTVAEGGSGKWLEIKYTNN